MDWLEELRRLPPDARYVKHNPPSPSISERRRSWGTFFETGSCLARNLTPSARMRFVWLCGLLPGTAVGRATIAASGCTYRTGGPSTP